MSSVDYYEVLGVSRSADPGQIKQAYKKQALKWHPDKNRNNPQAEEMFKLVADAYATLSDPSLRRKYDRGGDGYNDEFRDNDDGGYGRPGRSHGGMDFAEELFNQFFRDFASPMGMGGGMRTRSLFDDPFFSDPFMNDPFFSGSSSGRSSGRGRDTSDPFGFGFGGFGDSSSSTQISFGGSDGGFRSMGRSVTTHTTIDADGTRRSKTVTTVRHPDGRVEKTESESRTDATGRALPPSSSRQALPQRSNRYDENSVTETHTPSTSRSRDYGTRPRYRK